MNIKRMIKYCHINIRGLRPKLMELSEFIQECQIDIISVNETFLKPSMNIDIPGFDIFRKDRKTRNGGGVALIINKGIKFEEISPPKKLSHTNNEFISVFLPEYNTTVTSLYCPTGKPSLELITKLKTQKHSIILGDLNVKNKAWGSSVTTKAGKDLDDHLNSIHMTCINNGQATHTNDVTGKDEVLDLCLIF